MEDGTSLWAEVMFLASVIGKRPWPLIAPKASKIQRLRAQNSPLVLMLMNVRKEAFQFSHAQSQTEASVKTMIGVTPVSVTMVMN